MNPEQRREPPGDAGIDDLVVACLDAVEESGPDVIEEFCRRHPAHAEVLRRRLAMLLDTGLLPGKAEPDEPRLPAAFGEFRVIARLGGGGMGVVFRAVQADLGREVAIKTIRPELLHFRDARSRFRREIETVAKLSHPGIVPVYGSGEHEGAPWFAMEFVPGAPLSQVLDAAGHDDVARRSGQDLRRALVTASGGLEVVDTPLFVGSWLDACLRLGRDVATALDHAHRLGVLHRDVKPSNVLLGVDGRARLFDFGLARPDDGDVDGLTRTGAMVGSLPYMAPEQVRGGPVDRRTDVYGLAATMVELLTLQPPFPERDQQALRRAIEQAPRPQLQVRNRAIPRDLQIVLEKALAVEPADRYASAAELARDLDAVLEVRPIAARPDGALRRVRRWARRRPTVAVAAASLLLLLIGAPIVLLVANARIAAALARAEARFADAHEAILGLAATVADEDLREVPGVGPIRRDVLERSLRLFDRLLLDRAGDEQLQLERARLQRQTASVVEQLGDRDAAAALRSSSERYLRERLEKSPGDAVAAFDLADLLVDVSLVAAPAQLTALEEAQELLVVAAADPAALAEGDVRALRRQALHNRANVLRRLQRTAESEQCAALACREAELLAACSPPGDARARLALGASHGLLGVLHLDARRADEADRELALAERVLAELVDEDPRPEHRFRLGVLLTNAAQRAIRAGRGADGEPLAMQAVEQFEQLCREQPWRNSWRRRLAMACDAVGGTLLRQDRAADAVTWLARSVREMDTLVAVQPDDAALAVRAAIAHHNLASALLEQGRRVDAAVHADAGEVAFARLADDGDRTARGVWPLARLLQVRTRLGVAAPPAPEQLEQVVRSRGEPDDEQWLQLAECAADIVGQGGEVEAYAALALRALGAAVDAGFTAAARIDGSRVFDVLRDRPEFSAARARMR